MRSPAVFGERAWIAKPLKDGVDGAALAARAASLRRAGLRTPAARFAPGSTCLLVRRVRGIEGRALLLAEAEVPPRLLARLVAPLEALHALDPQLLDLPPLDLGRRVRPRLRGRTRLQRRAAALWPELVAASSRLTAPAAVLHGDYHPGQLLFPARGRSWLLDLDDMALGPRELDHGNLLAYLLSRPELTGKNPADAHERLAGQLLVLADLRTGPLALGTAAALVRRALKLEERGGAAAHLERLLDLAERLAGRVGPSGPAPSRR